MHQTNQINIKINFQRLLGVENRRWTLHVFEYIDAFDFLPTKLRMHNAHVHMYCVFERSLSTEHLWKLIDYSNKHKSIIDLTHSIESEKSITMK